MIVIVFLVVVGLVKGKGYQFVVCFWFVKLKTCNKLVGPDMEFCFGFLKPLSLLFSSLFWYSEGDGEMVFRNLLGSCLDNTSISAFCEEHPGVSADTVLKLGYLPLDVMVAKCNTLLAMSARMGLKSGLYRGCDVSLDYHDRPYNGKRREYTIKTMVDGKARRCYRYAVSSLTGYKRFLATGVQLYREGDSNRKMVEKLLDTTSPGFDLVLMDRYFVGVDVFNTIEEKGMDFLTPYKINETTDEMYRQSLLDDNRVKEYFVRKRKGKGRNVFMHLLPHPEDEYHAYVSSLPHVAVKEHYPHRWNEENLFKTLNLVIAATSTIHEPLRILLFTMGLILASLWKLLVRSKQHMTVKKYRKQLYSLLNEHTFFDGRTNKTTLNE